MKAENRFNGTLTALYFNLTADLIKYLDICDVKNKQ